MVKTIILVVQLRYTNSQHFWGLGDVIRGMLGMTDVAKRHNLDFFIDLFNHPISNFFEPVHHPYMDLVNAKREKIEFVQSGDERVLITLICNFLMNKNEDVLLLGTNMGEATYNYNFSNDDKLFIKSHLIPVKKIEERTNLILKTLPEKYKILHFRIGDDYFNNFEEINFDKVIEKITSEIDSDTIFMTDFEQLKKEIGKRGLNIAFLETKTCHIGLDNINNLDRIEDTILEFNIVCRSSKITSYTSYQHISGFARIPSFLYNIPIIIKKECNFFV